MNKIWLIVLLGLFAGTCSWAVVGLLTDRFEPFDTALGFYSGQLILIIGAIYYGYSWGLVAVYFFLLSAYVGMNTYAYLMGSSEFRAWFGLGLVTTTTLLLLPFLAGVITRWIKIKKLRDKIPE